jgi:NADPH:quinone reductase-like Zn-dependent oxidoreductase
MRAVHLTAFGNPVDGLEFSEAPISMSPLDVIFKPLTVRGFFMGHPEYAAKIPSAVKRAAAMISSGEVRLPVAVYPVSAIKEAVAHALQGGMVLLKIGESSA